MRSEGDGDDGGMLTINNTDMKKIYDHCRQEFPNEACGILAGGAGKVKRVYPVKNIRPSPVSYEMDPEEQFRVLKDIRQADLAMVGVYHSHPSGPAYPSSVDVEKAYWPGTLFPNYPEAVYVIISLRDRQHPAVKGFSIVEGTVTEVPLTTSE